MLAEFHCIVPLMFTANSHVSLSRPNLSANVSPTPPSENFLEKAMIFVHSHLSVVARLCFQQYVSTPVCPSPCNINH